MSSTASCEGDDEGLASSAACSCAAVTVDLIDSGGDGEGARGAKEKVRIPRQIWRMVEALLENGAHLQPGLFVEKGAELEVRGIREAVDSGLELPQHGAHSMVEVCGGGLTPKAFVVVSMNSEKKHIPFGRPWSFSYYVDERSKGSASPERYISRFTYQNAVNSTRSG